MLTEQEIDEAIKEIEAAPSSYKNCEKLAVFYYLKNNLFGEAANTAVKPQSDFISNGGTSDFLKAVRGKSWEEVLPLLDELMSVVKELQPNLYAAVLRRLNQ